MANIWLPFAMPGGALGVTFAGDLFSLYLFWEIMALASVYLVLAQKTKGARSAAFRYFMWHFLGGNLSAGGNHSLCIRPGDHRICLYRSE